LVADDDEHLRFLLSLALRRGGFAPLVAANGREAVDLFRQRQGEISLVLLDVCMPVLDGPGTLAQIRQIDPRVPCCFLTGYAQGYGAADLLALGAARVWEKPCRFEEILQVLGELYNGQGSSGCAAR
jgi:CheY-like chemotaxis protein